MSNSLITAHSGCEGTERDSLESIDRAIFYGADGIEVDVRLAPDGQIRLSHNLLDSEGYLGRPLVKDALAIILDTGLFVNLDIKEPEVLLPVIDLAEEMGLSRDRLIISGCTTPERLSEDPSIAKRIRVFLNLETIFQEIYLQQYPQGSEKEYKAITANASTVPEEWFVIAGKKVLALGAEVLNLSRTYLTERTAAIFREVNCPVSVWTINSPDQIEGILRLKPFNITTTIPHAVIKAAAYRRLWSI